MRREALVLLASHWFRNGGYECRLCDSADFARSWLSEPEIFSAIMILELVGDEPIPDRFKHSLAEHITRCIAPSGLIHFFEDPRSLPPDTDCTAVGVAALWKAHLIERDLLIGTARRVASNVGASGVIQVYLDPSGERADIIDPVVCVNALYLLNLAGLRVPALETEAFVAGCIADRTFISRSRYYVSEDTFHFFASRLVRAFPERYANWLEQLRQLIRARLGLRGTVLELAQRAIAAQNVNLAAIEEVRELLRIAKGGGEWPACPFFQFGRRKIYFGSSILTTAFAARALREKPIDGDMLSEGTAVRVHGPPRLP